MVTHDVNEKNRHKMLERIKKNTSKIMKQKNMFNISNRMRISKYKMAFGKGYTPNWTNKIYTVHSIQPTVPVTYFLKYHNGEVPKGRFNEQQLNKFNVGDVYLVNKNYNESVIAARALARLCGKYDTSIAEAGLI